MALRGGRARRAYGGRDPAGGTRQINNKQPDVQTGKGGSGRPISREGVFSRYGPF